VSTQPAPEATCVVCATPVALDARRCPSCGLARPAARGRGVLARGGFAAVATLLLVVWVVTLVVVATAR